MPNSRTIIAALALIAGIESRSHALQTSPSSSPTFEFHSGFWINLHHFLYHLAQPPGPPPRSPVPPPIGALSADEQRAWNDAIAYYRASVIQHDLLFDDRMGEIKSALAAAERDSVLRDNAVGAELTRVLDRVAAIYRKHWWPTHNAMNDLWIAALQPLLRILGPKLGAQLATAYGTSWYPAPIRVDVSVRAGPRVVAYTTGTTHGHVVVASTDPCDQGYAALETLFHEASHTIVDDGQGPIGEGIAAAAKARHVPPPPNLWHALMFYTQGEFMRRDLAALGVPYEPESGICDVYRGAWIRYRNAAALFWDPYLSGKVPLDSALNNVVWAVSSPP